MVKITGRRYCLLSIAVILLFPLIFGCTRKDKAPDAKAGNIEQERIVLSVDKAADKDPKRIVVANVNGVNISMAALVREMNRISPYYMSREGRISPETDRKIRDDAMNSLIFRELAVREAARQKLSVDRARINEIIKQIKAGLDSPEAYRKYLESRGVSEAELRQEIERSHLFEMITGKEVYAAITVDEKMLKEKYEQEKSLFASPGDSSRGRSFGEVKRLLERMVKAEQGADRMRQWEKKLRDKAVVRIVLAGAS